MAFGFSVSDFLTVGKLITDIILSLRDVGGSASEYQGLHRELGSLQRALQHVDKLSGRAEQQPAINAIKCAALMCQHPLTEFYAKITRKYEGSLGLGKSRGKIRDWKDKVQWGLGKKEEVVKLRGYLNAHVGSINMLLMAHGLEMLNLAADQAVEDQQGLQNRLEESQVAMIGVREDLREQRVMLRSSTSVLAQVLNILSGEVVPHLKNLVDLAVKVWRSNLQIHNMVLRWQTDLPYPDLRHTYFQDPVKFEDALGRILPIPSEYDFCKVSAIIREQFKHGPGHRKVIANQYELFNARYSDSQLTRDNWTHFLPGAYVKMAVVVQQPFGDSECCPMPTCGSRAFREDPGGGKVCTGCNKWFGNVRKKRKLDLASVADPHASKHKRVKIEPKSASAEQSIVDLDSDDDESEDEIEIFQNIRVHQLTAEAKSWHKVIAGSPRTGAGTGDGLFTAEENALIDNLAREKAQNATEGELKVIRRKLELASPWWPLDSEELVPLPMYFRIEAAKDLTNYHAGTESIEKKLRLLQKLLGARAMHEFGKIYQATQEQGPWRSGAEAQLTPPAGNDEESRAGRDRQENAFGSRHSSPVAKDMATGDTKRSVVKTNTRAADESPRTHYKHLSKEVETDLGGEAKTHITNPWDGALEKFRLKLIAGERRLTSPERRESREVRERAMRRYAYMNAVM